MMHVQGLANRVLTDLRLAKRDTELIDIMTKFVKDAGFCAFQLAPGPHNPALDPTSLLAFGSYNLNWKRQYATEPSCRHDPARAQAIMRAGGVHWLRAFKRVRDPAQRAFVQASRAQGFRDGITTPVHGPQGCVAIMMFAAGHVLNLDSEDEEALSHIAMALHQRVRRITAAALVGIPQKAHLTAREVECLQWVLEGKTNWEIGVLTGVTARTVQFHLSNSARKLGVFNRVQAAVGALIRGDVSVSTLKHSEASFTGEKILSILPPNANSTRNSNTLTHKYAPSFLGKPATQAEHFHD
jgi:DNA-binding CsgD family transcriptional regulator